MQTLGIFYVCKSRQGGRIWKRVEREEKRAKSGWVEGVGEQRKEIYEIAGKKSENLDGGWLMKEGILDGDGASPKIGW